MIHRLGQSALGGMLGLTGRWLLPGHDLRAILIAAALGAAGATIAGWGGERLRLYPEGQPAGFAMSSLGAVAALLLYSVFVH